MTRSIDDQEFDAVLALPYPARHEYFLEKVLAWGMLWSLRGEEGWVLLGDEDGKVYIPVWPHERFAAACIGGSWLGTEPRPVELREWVDKWLPGILADQRLLAVFPTPAGKALSVGAVELSANLGRIIPVDPEEEARASAKRLEEAVKLVKAYEAQKKENARLIASSHNGAENDDGPPEGQGSSS